MYDQYYGFSERPFSLLPDPDFLYLGDQHRAALDTLELAIFNHSGFCVISGGIGAGKTTLIRELLNRLNDDVQVGLVSNTHPSFGELMQWVMAAYGLSCGTGDRIELHKRFVDYTIQRYAAGKHTLLIIDEAQNLSLAALEELRMLSNVNSGKDLLLQVILVGQSELREKLRKPELVQFAQRISIDCYLGGLTADETARYIQHRVTHAGGAAELFTADACRRVHELSQGVPRVINRLCDLSLVYGFAQQREQIDAEQVEAVAQEQRLGEAMEAARRRAVAPTSVAEPVVAEKQTRAVRDDDVSHDVVPAPEKGVSTDLHTLVVNAEKSAGAKGGRGALWLFLGVAVMVGAIASRDIWLPAVHDLTTLRVQTLPESKAPVKAVLPARVDAANVAAQARLAKQQAAEKTKLEQAERDEAEREETARLAEQQAAEKVKLEQAKRDKARHEVAARIAKQKAADKRKLERAKRNKAKRVEAARLAKQRAAGKAKREQAERKQAERERVAPVAATKPDARASELALDAWAASPEWSEEGDE